MTDVILYPTETLYALGVNAVSVEANERLDGLKGRGANKFSSWLVRSIDDMERYAEVTDTARKIIAEFLPGSLTIILKSKGTVPEFRRGEAGEVSFRMSPDPIAQKVVAEFMEEHDAPLTCTSANVSGSPAFSTVGEILQQFGKKANWITKIYDDGPRKGLASTVVRVVDDTIEVIREGEISEADILECIKSV